jgi:hypothetical protein
LNPTFLLAQGKRLAHHFEQNRSLLQQNLEQIQDDLKLLEKERQEFITHALHTRMADDEFGTKIAIHYEKAKPLERREAAIKEEIDTYADLDFDARVSAYVQNLQAGLEEITKANPDTTEERHSLFLRKKRLVDELLEECVIDEDRQIHIKFRTDKLNLVPSNKTI